MLGLAVCDSALCIVAVDEPMALLLRRSPGELVGVRAIDLVAPVHRPRMMAVIDILEIADQSAVTVPCLVGALGDPPTLVRVRCTRMAGEGPVHYVCTALEPEPLVAGGATPAAASAHAAAHTAPDTAADAAAQAAPDPAPASSVTASTATTSDAAGGWDGDRAGGADGDLAGSLVSGMGTAEGLRHGSPQTAAARGPMRRLGDSMGASARAIARPLPGPGLAALPPAEVDSLTGLATRTTLVRGIDALVEMGADFAVVLVDLDEFKSVNDLHGHEVGDEVLVHIAQRLRLCVRPEDLVVRFGGDEFVILCRNRAAARTVAERIVDLVSAPIGTNAGAVTITASVGISDSSIPLKVVGDLFARADAAMYHAKRLGKNRFFVYDAELHAKISADRRTEVLLRDALEEGRIRVHYQPIMDAEAVDVVGVEAVARLVDEDGDVHLPDTFLPVAERAGLIGAIDAWVLAESCRCIGEVSRTLDMQLAVSVNISAQFASRADLADVVQAALESARMPPSALMLEVPATVMMHLGANASSQLMELRGRGVRVALDNFGAGDAPLSVLRELPLSHIKMDRPCASRILVDERDAAMLEAVTWLTDQLGLTWIAEGVETDEQWQAVRRFGPGLAQGYLFARPLPEQELRTVLGEGISGAGRLSVVSETIGLLPA